MKKKQKKEPNSVMSNLNILIDKDFCAYAKSRIKNIFKVLKMQLEPEEFAKLEESYAKINNSATMLSANEADYEAFTNYVKSLTRKYAKC